MWNPSPSPLPVWVDSRAIAYCLSRSLRNLLWRSFSSLKLINYSINTYWHWLHCLDYYRLISLSRRNGQLICQKSKYSWNLKTLLECRLIFGELFGRGRGVLYAHLKVKCSFSVEKGTTEMPISIFCRKLKILQIYQFEKFIGLFPVDPAGCNRAAPQTDVFRLRFCRRGRGTLKNKLIWKKNPINSTCSAAAPSSPSLDFDFPQSSLRCLSTSSGTCPFTSQPRSRRFLKEKYFVQISIIDSVSRIEIYEESIIERIDFEFLTCHGIHFIFYQMFFFRRSQEFKKNSNENPLPIIVISSASLVLPVSVASVISVSSPVPLPTLLASVPVSSVIIVRFATASLLKSPRSATKQSSQRLIMKG